MAEEVARQLTVRGEQDTETLPSGKPRPSIEEVAMQCASLRTASSLNSVITESHIDTTAEPTEQIVVDLRSVIDTVEHGTTVEFHHCRETPNVLDTATLQTVAPSKNGHARTLAVEQLKTLRIVEPETEPRPADPASLEIASPMSGLAVASTAERAAKRIVDVSIALVASILLLPLLLLIALLVKITSRGPVMYKSTRIGMNGEEFTFLKFRSMYDGAEELRVSLDILNEQSGPVFKMKEDPRITPLGRFLRKTSIDELPQLLHVLSGKMSLVGPRPALSDEVAQYDARALQRLAVKPGITCTWQVSGRSELDFDTWVDMDVDYIRNWSLLNDFRLLVLTIPAVLGGKGAY